ncbi:MAG: hypothetical protein R3D59_10800 [Paracoccaceae bacterium]
MLMRMAVAAAAAAATAMAMVMMGPVGVMVAVTVALALSGAVAMALPAPLPPPLSRPVTAAVQVGHTACRGERAAQRRQVAVAGADGKGVQNRGQFRRRGRGRDRLGVVAGEAGGFGRRALGERRFEGDRGAASSAPAGVFGSVSP